MPIFDRSPPTEIELVDRWSDGFGWIAHPEEQGVRVSHAMAGDDGVWLFDPLDGPGLSDHLSTLGSVAGVAVLSGFHVRDAAILADRHGVPVYLPTWMDRAAAKVGASIEHYAAPSDEWVELGDSDITVRTVSPPIGWRELVAYDRASGTLRVADVFSTLPELTVGPERLGCYILHRPDPPTEVFADVCPERILCGHGEGIFDDVAETLDSTLANARRRLPRALVSQAPAQIAAMLVALADRV